MSDLASPWRTICCSGSGHLWKEKHQLFISINWKNKASLQSQVVFLTLYSRVYTSAEFGYWRFLLDTACRNLHKHPGEVTIIELIYFLYILGICIMHFHSVDLLPAAGSSPSPHILTQNVHCLLPQVSPFLQRHTVSDVAVHSFSNSRLSKCAKRQREGCQNSLIISLYISEKYHFLDLLTYPHTVCMNHTSCSMS